MKKWDEVFTELTRTDVYSDTAPIGTKADILRVVWEEDIPRLKETYDRRGIGPEGEIGFGMLVEAFAHKSPKLPKNSAAGTKLANLLLHALHSGDAIVGTGYRLSNPDMVWIENRGRRSVITGIGEVKSSIGAVKVEQLQNFDSALRLLLKKVTEDKQKDKAIGYLMLKKITLAEPLRKVLIVPAWEAANAKWLPQDWRVAEIEFSYDELVFTAQHIWPEFRTDFKAGEGYLPRYEREFLARFVTEWGKPRLDKIFVKTRLKPFPVYEYLLYALGMLELPLANAQVGLAAACVKEAGITPSFPPEILDPASLSQWERKFLERFQLLWGKGITQYALHFLHDRRSFVGRLRKITRRADIKELLRDGAHPFDLLDT